jgi:hypothetical protein
MHCPSGQDVVALQYYDRQVFNLVSKGKFIMWVVLLPSNDVTRDMLAVGSVEENESTYPDGPST